MKDEDFLNRIQKIGIDDFYNELKTNPAMAAIILAFIKHVMSENINVRGGFIAYFDDKGQVFNDIVFDNNSESAMSFFGMGQNFAKADCKDDYTMAFIQGVVTACDQPFADITKGGEK